MREFKIVAAMMRTIKRRLEVCGCRKIKTQEMLICGSEVQHNRERSEATSIRRESVRIFVERTRSGASVRDETVRESFTASPLLLHYRSIRGPFGCLSMLRACVLASCLRWRTRQGL